jgi:hypothetical protein
MRTRNSCPTLKSGLEQAHAYECYFGTTEWGQKRFLSVRSDAMNQAFAFQLVQNSLFKIFIMMVTFTLEGSPTGSSDFLHREDEIQLLKLSVITTLFFRSRSTAGGEVGVYLIGDFEQPKMLPYCG